MSMAGPFAVERDDPCLDGHFPGNPLVPGVVVLDFAAHALPGALPPRDGDGAAAQVAGVAQVKFASPLRPGEPFTIEYRTLPEATCVGFRCTSADRLIAEGVFLLRLAQCV